MDKHPVSIRLHQRLIFCLALGVTTYFALNAYPYFSFDAVAWSVLFVLVLAYFSVSLAALAIGILFGISLSFHAFPLFILYFFVFLFFFFLVRGGQPFAAAFIIICSAVLLSKISVGNYALPVEYLVVIAAPLLLGRGMAPVAAVLAYLWCAAHGVINQHEFVGNLPIGLSNYNFYTLHPLPRDLLDLSWFMDKLVTFPAQQLSVAATALAQGIFKPGILLGAAIWGLTGFLMAFLFEKRKIIFDFTAMLAGISGIIMAQFSIISFYPQKVDFDFGFFAVTAALLSLVVFCVYGLIGFLAGKYKRAPLGVDGKKRVEAVSVNSSLHVELPPLQPKNTPKMDAFLNATRPTLEDSLKIQRQINDYIKQRFVHDATALAIDVVGSTSLKSGENDENVIVSFTEYWRFVDALVSKREGRLMNRAGDGAIYVFKYADFAVFTAKDILKGLERFNRKGNTLKNPFRVRIGMDTGRIVEESTSAGRDVFSRVVDIAAHLEGMAPEGGVLVSENTFAKLSKTKQDFAPHGRLEKDNINAYILTNL